MKYCLNFIFVMIALILYVGCKSSQRKEDVLIAVATNFAEVAALIEADFEKVTQYNVTLSIGATGQLYAQIINGAPFDILLAADQTRPLRLAQGEFGVKGSRFTYAKGSLVLWSKTMHQISGETLGQGDFRRLAIANPDIAPYGRAASDVLHSMGLSGVLASKIAFGENIGQTYGLVASGNAELGLIALSAVVSSRRDAKGKYWVVPQHLYTPILQDAVLLSRGEENIAAKAFLDYLQSDTAKAVMKTYGYTQ